ncbi:hypothetical protein T310_6867, partial [Rasamsonia emersonii CBS 393.64]
ASSVCSDICAAGSVLLCSVCFPHVFHRILLVVFWIVGCLISAVKRLDLLLDERPAGSILFDSGRTVKSLGIGATQDKRKEPRRKNAQINRKLV